MPALEKRKPERILFSHGSDDEGGIIEDKGGDDIAHSSSGARKDKQKKQQKKRAAGAGSAEAATAASSRAPVAAAWVDEADEKELIDVTKLSKTAVGEVRHSRGETVLDGKTLSARLEGRHRALFGDQSWAALPAEPAAGGGDDEGAGDLDDEKDETDDLLRRRAGGLRASGASRGRGGPLPSRVLALTRVRDANMQDFSPVKATEFHPNGQLLLTAGADRRLRIFQIDGKLNPRVQSVKFSDLAPTHAHFSPDGATAMVTGPQKWFYTVDLAVGRVERTPYLMGRQERAWGAFSFSPDGSRLAMAGDAGNVVLVDPVSRQMSAAVKMNQNVTAMAFTPDSRHLMTSGDQGEVYLWDLRMANRCVNRFADDGAVRTTSLASGPDGSHFATGSDSGVVNLYRSPERIGEKPGLLKAVLNLTTTIDTIQFSHDGQMLAMASSEKEAAVKILHVPTRTVFSNWPTQSTKMLGTVKNIAFSPSSSYMAILNSSGRVLLYKMLHYC